MSSTAQDSSSAPSSGSNPQESASGEDDYVRQPKRTVMACSYCRGRKIKCDGARPLCGNCTKRTQPCVYAPVQKKT